MRTAGMRELVVGGLTEKWGRLVGDRRQVLEGKRVQLIGTLENRYGFAPLDAERIVARLFQLVTSGRKSDPSHSASMSTQSG